MVLSCPDKPAENEIPDEQMGQADVRCQIGEQKQQPQAQQHLDHGLDVPDRKQCKLVRGKPVAEQGKLGKVPERGDRPGAQHQQQRVPHQRDGQTRQGQPQGEAGKDTQGSACIVLEGMGGHRQAGNCQHRVEPAIERGHVKQCLR